MRDGVASAHAGRTAEAIEAFRIAASMKPFSPEALGNLGNALREAGEYRRAIECLRHSVALKPQFFEGLVNLGAALDAAGRLEEAVGYLEQAVALRPDSAPAHSNLASVLTRLGRLDEAGRSARRARELDPGSAEAANNQGALEEHTGRLEEAIACYREAIRLRPSLVEAHTNLGMALLLAGRFEEGWEEYEWRLRARGAPRVDSRPLWDGSPLGGRTILLLAEQGLGDTIQFVRYAALVAARGGRVVLESPPRLAALLASVPGVAEVIHAGARRPEFDYWAPLMSLPRICGTNLESIPAMAPYVTPNRRREPIGGIGLVWSSNAAGRNVRARSLAPAELAPLGRVPGVRYFSLQRDADLAAVPFEIVNLEKESGEAEDTAAAIEALDLVISVDTMVAHLAGALAKPVWTLLPFAPDFRWLLQRSDSPWYPAMRLFRHPRPGDWGAVVQQVAESLRHADR